MITGKNYKNMSQIMRLIWLSLFLILIVPSADSQTNDSFPESITNKFNDYCRKIPREEVYVQTDRDDYIAGEEIWFKAYLMDRQSSKFSSGSKILYFEILNSEKRPVVQKRIRLEEGFGPGQVVIPDTLSTGVYNLRAYTNWMKNFLPYNCFSKKLNIYNALRTQSDKVLPGNPSIHDMDTRSGSQLSLSGSGFNIAAKRLESGNVSIAINTSRDFRSRIGSTCYLFIQTHGIINAKRMVNLADDSTRIEIPGTLLIPGINHITVFNNAGLPIAEKFNYTPRLEKQTLLVKSPDSCKTRGKKVLNIEIKDEQGREIIPSGLSMSVAPATDKAFPDLADYMVFGSEFGTLPDEIMKSDLNNIPVEKLNAFLSGIRSQWIDWNTILSGKYPELNYVKETEHHYLYGRLINKITQEPDKERYLFLSMPSKHVSFQYAKTDANGDFTFTLPLGNGIMDLIIQPEDINRNNNIKIESSFSNIYPESLSTNDTSVIELPKYISKLAINYQVKKIYGSDESVDKSKPLIFTGGTKRFYGKPDIELVLKDYIKLPVMQEVFFELMPGVFLKKKKSTYEITISDPVENKIYDKPPVLFADGVVINDPAIIANLDPELVEKIDAVKARYFVGDYLFLGLVNVITKTGDFSNFTLPDYAVRLPYRVSDPVKTFSSPDYSDPQNKRSRLPDFRNTLYWNPAVVTDNEGKSRIEFWSSDFVTDYVVNIQGITQDGKPLSVRKKISVK
jgi:hypothetical protein